MRSETKRILDGARSGQWAVDEETGSHLRRAITQMQERLAGIAPKIVQLQRKPPFGDDQYAQTAARHFQMAMDSDDQSLVRVVEALRENLTDIVDAIDEAVARYDASDEAATQYLGKFKD
nr:hypothetical protein [Amycolatopsis granulosa]